MKKMFNVVDNTWYVHKDTKDETIGSQLRTNNYGKYKGDTYLVNHHSRQKQLINQ